MPRSWQGAADDLTKERALSLRPSSLPSSHDKIIICRSSLGPAPSLHRYLAEAWMSLLFGEILLLIAPPKDAPRRHLFVPPVRGECWSEAREALLLSWPRRARPGATRNAIEENGRCPCRGHYHEEGCRRCKQESWEWTSSDDWISFLWILGRTDWMQVVIQNWQQIPEIIFLNIQQKLNPQFFTKPSGSYCNISYTVNFVLLHSWNDIIANPKGEYSVFF